MTAIVVDTSVSLGWILLDEADSVTILAQTINEIVVPQQWLLEMTNGLLIAEKRQRISPDQVMQGIAAINSLSVVVDPHTGTNSTSRTLGLARAYGLTTYDSAYLELADRLQIGLATNDKQLRSAATKLGVILI